jgi:hypothetical protein
MSDRDPCERTRCTSPLADEISAVVLAAGGGEDGWQRLDWDGGEQASALATLAAIASCVARRIREGKASEGLLREVAQALRPDDAPARG